MENIYKNTLFYTFLAIFGLTGIVTLLGITGLIPLDASVRDILVKILLVEVVTAVVLLYKSANFFTKTPEQNAKEIVGYWWELIHNKEYHVAASFTKISFSKNEQLLKVGGDGYNESFKQTARWDSAPAIYNANNNSLLYYWQGFRFGENLGKKFSGVGVLNFTSASENGLFHSAIGWYSTGNIEEGKAEINNYMEFVRATKEEVETMTNGTFEQKHEMFKNLLKNWRKKYGRNDMD